MSRRAGPTARLAALLVMLAAGTCAQAATAMRCVHPLPAGHHLVPVLERWAQALQARSNGGLKVELLDGAAKVSPGDAPGGVARGEVECGFSLNLHLARTLPEMNVVMRPYALAARSRALAWPDSAAATYLGEALSAVGLRLSGWMQLSSVAALTRNGAWLSAPQDFNGLRIRGLSPALDAGLQALGALPTPLSGSKVKQALAGGDIDAGLTDIATAWLRRYDEVQDHVVASPLFSVFLVGFVNPKWYASLDDASRSAIDFTGRMAAGWAVEATEAATARSLFGLAGAGVRVRLHTARETEAMEAIMVPAFDQAFLQLTGKGGSRLLDRMKAMAGAAR